MVAFAREKDGYKKEQVDAYILKLRTSYQKLYDEWLEYAALCKELQAQCTVMKQDAARQEALLKARENEALLLTKENERLFRQVNEAKKLKGDIVDVALRQKAAWVVESMLSEASEKLKSAESAEVSALAVSTSFTKETDRQEANSMNYWDSFGKSHL